MLKHKANELIDDAKVALMLLKEGNGRFVSGNLAEREMHERDEALSHGQYPFVALLCCSDSRVSGELIFDQELGDIFEIRNAGNIVDTTVLGSLEYAILNLHIPLIVVMGHSKCGAINAAFGDVKHPENLQKILSIIEPAVDDDATKDEAAIQNALNMVAKINENSLIANDKAIVIGAFYNITNGKVNWL